MTVAIIVGLATYATRPANSQDNTVKKNTQVTCTTVNEPQQGFPFDKLSAKVRDITQGEANEHKNKILECVSPWITRLLAEPFSEKALAGGSVKNCWDNQIGDIFLLQTKVDETQVNIIDTAELFFVSFKNPGISLPKGEEDVLLAWQSLARKYLRSNQSCLSPERLYCTKVSKACYIAPFYEIDLTAEKLAIDDFWPGSQFKVVAGEFQAKFVKLRFNTYPIESSYGIRHRIEDFSSLVFKMSSKNLLGELQIANLSEVSIILKSFNPKTTSPSEVFVAIIDRKASFDPRQIPTFFYTIWSRLGEPAKRNDFLVSVILANQNMKLADDNLNTIISKIVQRESIDGDVIGELDLRQMTKSTRDKVKAAVETAKQSNLKRPPAPAAGTITP